MRHSKYGFSVGDRVMFIEEEDPDGGVYNGQCGTVCTIYRAHDEGGIGVSWDKENNRYHSCDGNCEEYHGWFVPYDMISHIECDLGEFEHSDMSILNFIGL